MDFREYIDTNNDKLKESKIDEVADWIKQQNFDCFWGLLQFVEQNPELQKFRDDLYRHYLQTLKDTRVFSCTSPLAYEVKRLEAKLNPNDWGKNIEWLSICVTPENPNESENSKYVNFYFALSGYNRDEEAKSILFDSNHSLRQFQDRKCWQNTATGKVYLEFLATWFLKRYDIRTASEIIHKIHRSAVQSQSVDIFPQKSVVVALVLFVTFFLCYFHQGSQLKFWEDYAWIWQTDSWDLKVWYNVFPLLFFVVVESVCLILLAVWMIRFRSYYLWFKLLLPRLLGGIVVGYLPLLLSGEIWDFAQKVDPLEGTFLLGTALLFSFYYLFTEIRNVVQNDRTAFYRGLRIGVIGLAESFFVGIFAQDLLAGPFVTGMGKIDDYAALNPATGLLGGLIYPKVLLLYFPLALLIGIFVQIIWEEKPITHPL